MLLNAGRPCANPGSFMGALHAALTSRQRGGFANSVRDVMKAGGCNCSRANLTGAILGAAFGFQSEEEPSTASKGIASIAAHSDGCISTGTSPQQEFGSSLLGIPLDWLAKTSRAEELLDAILAKI